MTSEHSATLSEAVEPVTAALTASANALLDSLVRAPSRDVVGDDEASPAAQARRRFREARDVLRTLPLPGPAVLADALDALFGRLRRHRREADRDTALAITDAYQALLGYLRQAAAGLAPPAMRLYAYYSAVVQAAGQPAPPPLDMFYPDLAPLAALPAPPPEALDAAGWRAAFDKALLPFLRDGGAQHLYAMRDVVAAAARAQDDDAARAGWRVLHAFVDNAAAEAAASPAAPTLELKRLLGAINTRLRHLGEPVPDSLLRPVLYSLAGSPPLAPSARMIAATLGLEAVAADRDGRLYDDALDYVPVAPPAADTMPPPTAAPPDDTALAFEAVEIESLPAPPDKTAIAFAAAGSKAVPALPDNTAPAFAAAEIDELPALPDNTTIPFATAEGNDLPAAPDYTTIPFAAASSNDLPAAPDINAPAFASTGSKNLPPPPDTTTIAFATAEIEDLPAPSAAALDDFIAASDRTVLQLCEDLAQWRAAPDRPAVLQAIAHLQGMREGAAGVGCAAMQDLALALEIALRSIPEHPPADLIGPAELDVIGRAVEALSAMLQALATGAGVRADRAILLELAQLQLAVEQAALAPFSAQALDEASAPPADPEMARGAALGDMAADLSETLAQLMAEGEHRLDAGPAAPDVVRTGNAAGELAVIEDAYEPVQLAALTRNGAARLHEIGQNLKAWRQSAADQAYAARLVAQLQALHEAARAGGALRLAFALYEIEIQIEMYLDTSGPGDSAPSALFDSLLAHYAECTQLFEQLPR